MDNLIYFIIRASVYLLVFGLGYYLLLHTGSGSRFRRFYILLSFLLSLGLASIGKISFYMAAAEARDGAALLLPEILIEARDGIAATGSKVWSHFSLAGFWYLIPLLIMIFFTVRLVSRLWKIYAEIKNHPNESLEGVSLVFISGSRSPFSFFHWIFVPECIKGSVHFDKVITHEKAHYHFRHSWDVVFIEIMRIVFWFHPAWYFFRNELQAAHEYEADNYVLKIFPRADYQKALLDFALDAHYLPITNPFNVSMIKKRFIMMNRNQKSHIATTWFRLLLMLPFVAAVFFIQSVDIKAQGVEKEQMKPQEKQEPVKDDSQIFTMVEEDPEYPGGMDALMKYLTENLRYPDKAREEKIQGTVFITFVVEKDGSLSGIKILRGVSSDLDAEAMRVLSNMPDWVPGKQRGENVRVQFNLPIRFVLGKEEKEENQ